MIFGSTAAVCQVGPARSCPPLATLRDLSKKPELFTPGHRACAGCGFPILVRAVLRAADEPVVVSSATGCLEVTSTLFPYSDRKSVVEGKSVDVRGGPIN